jgi:plastocyanin
MSSRHLLAAGTAGLVGLLAACSSSSSPAPSGNDASTTQDSSMPPPNDGAMGTTHMVTVGPNNTLTFSPASLTIAVGDTVTWTWASDHHSVTSGTGCAADNKFCSPGDANCAAGATSNTGSTYSHTFTTAGSFPYFCSPHCGAGMLGTITVQ